MNTIISIQEAKTLGRPIGKVDDAKITAFIIEVEQTIIRKKLGDSLYFTIVSSDELEDKYDKLVNGGSFEDRFGNTRYLTGLKTAIAYYVYAQNVRAGDFESTRYGMVIKDDPYSNGLSSKERDSVANSATAIAEAYLNEVIEYCQENDIQVGNGRGNLHITSGCVIRKVRLD